MKYKSFMIFLLALMFGNYILLLSSISSVMLYGVYFLMILGLIRYWLLKPHFITAIRSTLPYLLWVLFYLILGALISDEKNIFVSQLFRVILILIFVPIVITDRNDLVFFARFIQWMVLTNLVIAVLLFKAPVFQNILLSIHPDFFDIQLSTNRYAGLWGNPNLAGVASLISIIFSFWCGGAIGWIGRIAAVILIYLTAGRAATYLLILILSVYLIMGFSLIRRWLFSKILIIISALALVTLIILVSFWNTSYKINPESDKNISRIVDFSESATIEKGGYTRVDVTKYGLQKVLDAPLFGYGLGSMQIESVRVGMEVIGVHNGFLVVWGEIGIFGLLSYIFILGVGLRRVFIYNFNLLDKMGLISLWLVFLVHNFASHQFILSTLGQIFCGLLFHLPVLLRKEKIYDTAL